MIGVINLIARALGVGEEVIAANSRKKLAEIEAEIALTQARGLAAQKAAEHEQGWEMLAAENARTSWKDEFWTVLIAIPLVLSFVPGLQPYIAEGFSVLEADVPDWYKWAVGAAISFAFARRKIPEFWKRK